MRALLRDLARNVIPSDFESLTSVDSFPSPTPLYSRSCFLDDTISDDVTSSADSKYSVSIINYYTDYLTILTILYFVSVTA